MPLGSQATKDIQGAPVDTIALKKRIVTAKSDADKAKQDVYDMKGKGSYEKVYATQNALQAKQDSLKKARKQ